MMQHWQSHRIQSNGLGLHYIRTGSAQQASKATVILAHGITDNGLCWTRLARQLEEDFDLIMVDARGHGQSEKPEAGYSAADHAADLAGLIQGLGLTRPLLIGHSMGARSVAKLATDYPDLVAGIVLEDPAWFEAQSPAEAATRQAGMQQWYERLHAQQKTSLAEVIAAGKVDNPTWDDAEFETWASAKIEVDAEVLLKSSFHQDWREMVSQITCPSLLVTADVSKGAIISVEMAQEAVELNENFQIAHIRGAGHSIRREQFQAFVKAVTAFLKTVSS